MHETLALTITKDYTIDYNNQVVLVDTSLGNVTILLPQLKTFVTLSTDFVYYIKKVTGDAHTVTIKCLGIGQSIDGATSVVLSALNQYKGFKFDNNTQFREISSSTAATVVPAVLSKTDDTNVTLTLGGNPLTSLLAATSLTLGWTGTLADARITSSTTWNNKVTSLTAGTGISISGTTTVPIVTNTAPDQTVVFTNGTGISITGTYPNFTVTNTAPSTTSGTVTSVSVTTANGVSGSVATATTTPAIALTLGAITPTSVNGTTSTEIGYVSGVTSAIQTQLNSKQASLTTGTTAQYFRGDLSLATTPTTSYSFLQGVIGAAVGASVTRYNSFDAQTMSTTELPRQIAIPFACTLDRFYVTTTTAQPASGTLVVTIRKNSVDTALTVTIPISTVAGTNVADTTHSVSFAAGDLLAISFVNNATANSCTMSVSCRVATTLV